MSKTTESTGSRFCSECGTPLNPNAKFCHNCGASVLGGPRAAAGADTSNMLKWGLPAVALVVVVGFSLFQYSKRDPGAPEGSAPLGAMQAMDISSMTPEERADRLFNRVMRLSSEGKADSAAFFGPMALGAIEALQPLDAHRRYDMGVVSLVMGDAAIAAAQSDTILKQRPTHLLGLALAARAADARNNAAAAKEFRRRLLAAEATERKQQLVEYTDHEADVTAAIELARKK
ncbi:MAG TPA: zinc ribbon domain-containing protein [Gemmatimonadaceae bacterium]|nr:zinc ribbon domain-containing protein [Gemmatimonadaceae bacterium]